MTTWKKSVTTHSLPTLLLLIFSCTTYHMEFPQPVDGKNLYLFPQSMRGTWVIADEKYPDDGFVIEKNKVLLRMKAPKIYNGILDSLGTKKGEGLMHIKYDDQNMPIDTIIDYILKNNRLYTWEVEKESGKSFLFPGFPVALKNDTIYALPENNFTLAFFSLGPDAFLRRISSNQYILNIKQGNFMESFFKSDGRGWWQIVLLEITSDSHLLVSTPDFKKMTDDSNKVNCGSECYLTIEWTRQEIIQRIVNKNFPLEPLYDLKKKNNK